MVTLTEEESRMYQGLMNEGYGELAEFMRANAVRKHEVFESLKNADVESLYGPSVTAEMRDGMRRVIAGGDHDEVVALHTLLLTISKRNDASSSQTEPDHLLGFLVITGFLVSMVVVVSLIAFLFV